MTGKKGTVFRAIIDRDQPVSLECSHTSCKGLHFGLAPHALVAGFTCAGRWIEEPQGLRGIIQAAEALVADVFDGYLVEPGAESPEQLKDVCPRWLSLLGNGEILPTAAAPFVFIRVCSNLAHDSKNRPTP